MECLRQDEPIALVDGKPVRRVLQVEGDALQVEMTDGRVYWVWAWELKPVR